MVSKVVPDIRFSPLAGYPAVIYYPVFRFRSWPKCCIIQFIRVCIFSYNLYHKSTSHCDSSIL